MSALSKFAGLCRSYSELGLWPEGFEAACDELVSSVTAHPAVLLEVEPRDALRAGYILKCREKYREAATFLSRAYCANEALHRSDSFLTYTQEAATAGCASLLDAAKAGDYEVVRSVIQTSLEKIFASDALDGVFGAPVSKSRLTSSEDTAHTPLNSIAVVESVAREFCDCGVSDREGIDVRCQAAMWFAQRLLARSHFEPLLDENARAGAEGPFFPKAWRHFNTLAVDAIVPVSAEPIIFPACKFTATLLAAVSVLAGMSVGEIKLAFAEDALWLASEPGEELVLVDMQLISPPSIVDRIDAAVLLHARAAGLRDWTSEVTGFVPALASCDDNEECAMEVVGHVDVSLLKSLI
jgi:hypothetical protein